MPQFQDQIKIAIDAIETLAHGRKIDGVTICPRCQRQDQSLAFRTSWSGRTYWGHCGTHACLQWYYPELIQRKPLPQIDMGL